MDNGNLYQNGKSKNPVVCTAAAWCGGRHGEIRSGFPGAWRNLWTFCIRREMRELPTKTNSNNRNSALGVCPQEICSAICFICLNPLHTYLGRVLCVTRVRVICAFFSDGAVAIWWAHSTGAEWSSWMVSDKQHWYGVWINYCVLHLKKFTVSFAFFLPPFNSPLCFLNEYREKKLRPIIFAKFFFKNYDFLKTVEVFFFENF